MFDEYTKYFFPKIVDLTLEIFLYFTVFLALCIYTFTFHFSFDLMDYKIVIFLNKFDMYKFIIIFFIYF